MSCPTRPVTGAGWVIEGGPSNEKKGIVHRERERKTDKKTERGHTKEQEKSSYRAKPLFAYSDGVMRIGPLACEVEEISINKIRKKTFIFICQKYDRQRK